MLIKEAAYDKGCPSCGSGRKEIEPKIYGCDYCDKEISSPHDKKRTYLEIIVFYYSDKDADHLHFCCWSCTFNFIKKIQHTKYKCDYFIGLPSIEFDNKEGVCDYEKFLMALKSF